MILLGKVLWLKKPIWVSVYRVYPSFYLYLCLYLCLSPFLFHKDFGIWPYLSSTRFLSWTGRVQNCNCLRGRNSQISPTDDSLLSVLVAVNEIGLLQLCRYLGLSAGMPHL